MANTIIQLNRNCGLNKARQLFAPVHRDLELLDRHALSEIFAPDAHQDVRLTVPQTESEMGGCLVYRARW